MAFAAVPMLPPDGILTITDATGTPLSFTVAYEDGDFAVDDLRQGGKEAMVLYDRKIPYALRGNGTPTIKGKFSCHALVFTDATNSNILDVVRGAGTWASFVSTGPTTSGDLKTVTVKFTAEKSDFGNSADTYVTFKYVYLKAAFAEGEPGKFSIDMEIIPFASDWIAVSGQA